MITGEISFEFCAQCNLSTVEKQIPSKFLIQNRSLSGEKTPLAQLFCHFFESQISKTVSVLAKF